jgi:tRNA dimethylallyltransferase
MPQVLVLFGPTASGKTALLEKLFDTAKVRAEIISADSMQVYRGMDIGTAKPSRLEQEKIPHHLIDIKNPNEQFCAGEFVRLAEAACRAAIERGALPVVSGGTAFYLKNLIAGLSEAPPSNAEIRKHLNLELKNFGASFLMEQLENIDPISARRIHINDTYRLVRALEVYRLTGKPLSSFASAWNPSASSAAKSVANIFEQKNSVAKLEPHANLSYTLVGLRRNRAELYRRINERTAGMFAAGLYDEVKRLYDAGYTPDDPGLKAIGYKEFFVQQSGTPENGAAESAAPCAWRLTENLAQAQALIAQNSRRYAKRQITFFASLANVNWLDCQNEDEAACAIRKLIL